MPYMPKSAKPVEPYMPKSAKPVGTETEAGPPPETATEEPGLLDSVKSLVVPTREDFSAPSLKELRREDLPIDDAELARRLKEVGYGSLEEFNASAGLRNQEARLAAARANALSQTLAVLEGANPMGLYPEGQPGSGEVDPQVSKTMDEVAQRNPKSVLAGGIPGPNMATAGGRVAVAGVTGLIGAATRGQDPAAGGLLGAGVTAGLEGVMKGGGRLAKPLTKYLSKRITPALRELHLSAAKGEPTTDVSPLHLNERQTVVGEPPTEVLPANLRDAWEPTDLEPKTKGGTQVGVPTKAERPYFKEQTNVGPLRADEFAPEPKTAQLLPDEPNTGAKLARISELAAERPTGEMHPDELLSDSAFNLKNKRMADEVQLGRDILEGKVAPPKNETVAGRPSNVTPEQVKFNDAMAFLEGADDPALAKTVTKYLPRDIKGPAKWRDPEVTWIPARKVPGADAFIGGGSGDGPPNPAGRLVSGPPMEGPLMPTDVGEDFLSAAAESKQMLNRDLGWFEKFTKALSLPENRAGSDVAAAIRSLRGARAMKDIVMERLYPKLQKALSDLTPSDRQAVKRVISNMRDRKSGLEDVSKLPPAFRDLFVQAQREQQAMTVELAKGGYFNEAELKSMKKVLAQGQLHLHRSYQAFLAKNGYRPSEGAMKQAAEFFAEELGLDAMQANARVRAVVKDLVDENQKWTPQSVAAAFRDAGLLKARKLPPQLHKLMGVINDPSFVVADTAAEMAQLYHQMRVTRAIASPQFDGVVHSSQWVPGMDERPLWDPSKSIEENRRLFGELAGKYVAPQLREALVDLQGAKVRSFVHQLSDAFTGWFAFAKVTSSPITWARNLISNSFNLSVSGVPMTRWPELALKAAQSMKAASKRTTLREGAAGEWAQMALEDHATPQGRATDWGGSEARRIIEDVIRESPKGFVGVFDKLFRKYGAVRGHMGKVYEVADTLPRLMAYMHHVEDGVKNLDLPMEAARARASALVNRYFATGASVGPLFRGLASSGGSPFASWFVDNMRVTKNIVADAAKGQLGPLVRASLFSAIPMAAFYGLRQAFGMTDAEVSANERRLKGSWRDRQAFHDWLPVRTKDGSAYAISFDGLNPMAAFLKGPEGSFPKNIAASVLQGLSGSGWAEPFVDHTLARLGIAPAEYQPPVLPGQEGYRMASDFYQYMQPTLMRQFTDVARKAQLVPDLLPLRPTEEAQGLGEAAFTTFNPLSIEKVGARTMEGARRQVQGQTGEMKKAQKAGAKLPGEDRDKVQSEAQKRKEELRRRQQSR